MERSEEDILLETPITIRLDREYEIAPLKADRALRWRKAGAKLAQSVIPQLLEINQNGSGQQALAAIIPAIFADGIESIVEMMYLHKAELEENRDKIKSTVSHQQEVRAALQVFKLSLPFFQTVASGLTEIMGAMGLEKLADQAGDLPRS